MKPNPLQVPPDRNNNVPGLNTSSIYGNLTFEQAAQAAERCRIAFSTQIIDLPGTCIVFEDQAIGFNFQLRWQGIVKIAHIWEHPDLGLGIELEQVLPTDAQDWLDEVYPGASRALPRTALIFANELHRDRFAEAIAAR